MCEMCERENASHSLRNHLVAILAGIISVSAAHSATDTSEIPTAVAADIETADGGTTGDLFAMPENAAAPTSAAPRFDASTGTASPAAATAQSESDSGINDGTVAGEIFYLPDAAPMAVAAQGSAAMTVSDTFAATTESRAGDADKSPPLAPIVPQPHTLTDPILKVATAPAPMPAVSAPLSISAPPATNAAAQTSQPTSSDAAATVSVDA